ncbi:MAG TPA: hypothetical protein VFL57_04975 [Bryobacteraceae bacterium]|nr:hypothetical protein [Bryobacteraceae bacterium]
MQQVVEQVVCVHAGWDELLAAVRAGDIQPGLTLQERLQPSIRVLLARKSLRDSEDKVMAEVLASVIAAVRAGQIQTAAELARATRLAIEERVAPRRSAVRETSSANPSAALETHLSARERDMLRRFYVLAQEPADICRAMGVSMEEFTRAKSLARAAIAVSLAARRKTGTACA